MIITNFDAYEKELVDCGSVTCETYQEFLAYYRSMSGLFRKGETYQRAQKRAARLWISVKENKIRSEKISNALRPITESPSIFRVILTGIFPCNRRKPVSR